MLKWQLTPGIMFCLFNIKIYWVPGYKKLTKAVSFIYFMLYFSFSFGQPGILKGKVGDGGTALAGATISVANKTTLSNAKGEFALTLDPGTFILSVTHIGYTVLFREITIRSMQTQAVILSMIRKEQLGDAVLLGSRSVIQRSNLNTPVPVDLITSNELKQTGQPSLVQMLNFTAPSFNVSRQHLSEPATLRSLSPDHVLILLNGTRYHSPAGINAGGIRGTLGPGSVGNNLNSIPVSAIEKIEILRDGSSAQYGSDAIAGVMNMILKKTTGITSMNLHTGQHYKGDGETVQFGINRGFPISKKGYLNFSGDLLLRKPTKRGGVYEGTVYYSLPRNLTREDSTRRRELDNARIAERGFSRQTPVSNDGSIELTNVGFLVNGACPVTKLGELFWTGTINYCRPVNVGLYRYPKDSNQVISALHPDGFKPKITVKALDLSGILGARGKLNKGWNWEWNSSFGRSSHASRYGNTNNPSQFALGASAPTVFDFGANFFIQQTNVISFAKDFSGKIHGLKTFSLGFGGEYRYEQSWNRQGEEASWKNYDNSGKILQGGMMPNPGIHPKDIVNEDRRVAGLYADIETDLNDHFLVNMAARLEHYNDFGNNLAGKLAMRYKFSPAFVLRGSISNGFHAPGLQQIHYTSTISQSKIIGGTITPLRVGIFPNASFVTRAFGVKPLAAEKALNVSTGLTSKISPGINLTIDAFWIQIKNRIILSGSFGKSNPEVKKILASLPDVDEVRFITNAVNTRTAGLDISLNWKWKIRQGEAGLMLASNFARTNLFGSIQIADSLGRDSLNTNTLFNMDERSKMLKSQPGSKIILSANYNIRKWGFVLRNTRFGKTSSTTITTNPVRIFYEHFSAKMLTDVSINYAPRKWLTLTAGANNIFDVYPDRLKNYENSSNGILLFSNEASPFGYNGGYYFLNMTMNL
jgi:iron complex outermembrane receptor protein